MIERFVMNIQESKVCNKRTSMFNRDAVRNGRYSGIEKSGIKLHLAHLVPVLPYSTSNLEFRVMMQ